MWTIGCAILVTVGLAGNRSDGESIEDLPIIRPVQKLAHPETAGLLFGSTIKLRGDILAVRGVTLGWQGEEKRKVFFFR